MSEPEDPNTMSAALARFLPDGVQITGLRPLMTGYSNETYLVEGPGLILRLPPRQALCWMVMM